MKYNTTSMIVNFQFYSLKSDFLRVYLKKAFLPITFLFIYDNFAMQNRIFYRFCIKHFGCRDGH